MQDQKPLLIFVSCASFEDGMKACKIVQRGYVKYQLLENADFHVVCLGTHILVMIRAKATVLLPVKSIDCGLYCMSTNSAF